jgi:2-C-methyl-D-erythritol 4-phosphate cytidylyltransferase/2-C-methyl-D-erythritol 2,4-cyclodiphosphate synthase
VSAFLAHPGVDLVRVVVHPSDRQLYDESLAGIDLPEPVFGGENRQHSVLNGLRSLVEWQPDRVLVHDAARPFVSQAAIGNVIDGLDDAEGAVSAIRVVDTLKRERDGLVGETVGREALWRAQTPQGFRFQPLLAAHEAIPVGELGRYTDDAAVAQRAGMRIVFSQGDDENFKITTVDDLNRARRQLRAMHGDEGMVYRVGNGFDVHRFGGDGPLTLCGVMVPSPHGLVGHSDADVGLHALTDALLGAIGDGDIGDHFPPGDPQWRNAPSDRFLKLAADRVKALGGHIVNLDLTLICEQPKIAPHRDAMRHAVAEILAIDMSQVSIKATTTEKLGFTGRGEGIAANAIASVRLPETS